LSVRWRNGFQRTDFGGGFPESRGTAALAEAYDAFVSGTNIRFKAGVVDFFERFAGIADEREKAQFAFHCADRRELELPKINVGIDESHAVGVQIIVSPKLADDADFRFFIAFRPAEDEFLLGRKFVPGQDARAVEAENDGPGVLRENLAAQIVSDKEDGKFPRDATAPAHNLLWQATGQKTRGAVPI
jgi:hypothetical protein